MKTFRRYSIALLLIAFAFCAKAQDAMFSQFYRSTIRINPAETGNIEDHYRAVTQYRTQWASVTETFRTMAGSFDIALNRTKGSNSFIGLGGYVIQDVAGTSGLRTIRGAVTAAYHLGRVESSRFTFGLSAGYGQRSINFDGLAWDAQHNGVAYDPTLPSGEAFFSDQKGFPEASAGFLWKRAPSRRQQFAVGLAAHHLYLNQGFLENTKDPLITRTVLTGEYSHAFNRVRMDYHMRAQFQAAAAEWMLGGLARYRFGQESIYTTSKTSSELLLGAYYRWNDALIALVGYEYERQFVATISYDLNVSGLRPVTRGYGAIEISLMYLGKYPNQRIRVR